MIALEFDKRFRKAVIALDDESRRRAQKALKLFMENPRHPSLNFEVVLSSANYFTILVDRSRRILLEAIDVKIYRVFDIGSHDYIYRKYG
ncbi:hypothetical protein CO659_12510 [Rhizobium sp. S9]|nr:hypothetical protein TAL182_CH02232 [Rhizobium sp. TAL182]PDS97486.1 hypothetical protein CO659_12510 [Rhizobium sp. S9]